MDRDIERRKWPRLSLKLTVEFFSPSREELEGTGTTENVSPGGIYFRTTQWHELEVGQEVALTLSGFSAYNLGPLFRTLRGEARVLRLEPPDEEREATYGQAGVAVEFEETPRMDIYRMSA
ncbi:MAG: PilZ domain-containing protein [Candidatus Brocadiia bacterium]